MILDQEYLLEKMGFKRPSDLAKYLTDKRIPFDYGRKGRIWTTMKAVDSHLLKQDEKEWELS